MNITKRRSYGLDQVIVNRIDLYLFTHTTHKGGALKGTRNLNIDLINVNTYNNIIEYTSRKIRW